MGERFAPEFGEVWMERMGRNGTEWSDGKGSEAAIERHGVAESKSRLERGSNGEVKNGNDWEVDGKWLNVCG